MAHLFRALTTYVINTYIHISIYLFIQLFEKT